MENGADLEGLCVLVVEDEFLLAMELEAFLEQRGCRVLGPVGTIDRALAVLAHHRPAAAVLDVNLKGRRATAVAAALQDLEVPFVLVTGYSDQQLTEPELKGQPRLEKPLDRRKLLRALERVVQAAEQGGSA
ncbi:MAG TPA: response regulator [Geminicoccaceae bacterium]|nr:response regulator [Geminicoccaceae bacterium]